MLKDFQTKIGIQFSDVSLLETAFIHRSFLNEAKGEIQHNERLEFLGDAVLELIVTEYLYKTFPDKPEGEMTALRSALVKGERLAEVAKELDFGSYLKLSKGEARSGGSEKPYLLANTFEAVLGAIYLDKGFAVARKFVSKFLLPHLEKIMEDGSQIDAKSRFQEIAQEKLAITPTYELLSEVGPDHDKVFEMGAFLGKDLYGKGKGGNKQAAEQAAATEALKKIL